MKEKEIDEVTIIKHSKKDISKTFNLNGNISKKLAKKLLKAPKIRIKKNYLIETNLKEISLIPNNTKSLKLYDETYFSRENLNYSLRESVFNDLINSDKLKNQSNDKINNIKLQQENDNSDKSIESNDDSISVSSNDSKDSNDSTYRCLYSKINNNNNKSKTTTVSLNKKNKIIKIFDF